jgi:hypothetical protein
MKKSLRVVGKGVLLLDRLFSSLLNICVFPGPLLIPPILLALTWFLLSGLLAGVVRILLPRPDQVCDFRARKHTRG